ncbi:MAG: extracellular solute-binding protein, partial [Lawsonibacter sp.]|nr:extracellular solute-binding protein [Lawsonibacter sp.]
MKKILAALLATAMSLSLAACGGTPSNPSSGSGSGTPDPAPSGDKIAINVIAAEYGKQTKDWWAGFQNDFNAANEGIDLKVEVVSWNDIYTVVNTRVSNNAAPDILNIDTFADYVGDDLLRPIKDFVSDETYAKFYPAFIEQSNIDGTIWAIPDLASARAMYYNKDILEAAGVDKVPTTWAELRAACEAIKAYDANIYPWGVDMTTDEGQACFAYYSWTNGGDFTDASG